MRIIILMARIVPARYLVVKEIGVRGWKNLKGVPKERWLERIQEMKARHMESLRLPGLRTCGPKHAQ